MSSRQFGDGILPRSWGRGRGRIEGRGHGQALPGQRILRRRVDSIIEALNSIKLVPAPSDSHEIEPTLDDISIVVNESRLSGLSPANRDLEIMLRKCHKIKRYDIVPISDIVNILKSTQNDLPQMTQGCQEEVTCTFSNGPEHFFLQPTAQAKRAYLLGRWLFDMDFKNKLESLQNTIQDDDDDAQKMVGRHVVVRHGGSQILARGLITSVPSEIRASVYLCDYGEEALFEIDDMKHLPMALRPSFVEPMCFSAHLTSLKTRPYNSELKLDCWQIKKYFQDVVNDGAFRLFCTITSNPKQADHGIANQEECFVSLRVKKIFDQGQTSKDKGQAIEFDVAELIEKKLLSLEQEKIAENAFRPSVQYSKPTPQEIPLLRFPDRQVNVQDHSDSLVRGVWKYRMLQIINPGEFYLSSVYETLEHKKMKWQSEMQTFYKNPEGRKDFRIRTSRVFPGRCYAWHESSKLEWHRVRVLNPNTGEGGLVVVWLVDQGKEMTVNQGDMMELNPIFSSWEALAFKVYLVDVEPTSKSEWSKSSILAFQELCPEGKLLSGLMIERKRFDEYKVRPSKGDYFSFGMILSETRSCSPATDFVHTIQHLLVKRKVAKPCGIAAGSHDFMYLDDCTPYYSRRHMEDELRVSLQELVSPDSNLEVAKTGFTRIPKTAPMRGRRPAPPSPLARTPKKVCTSLQEQANATQKKGSIVPNKSAAQLVMEQEHILQGNQEDIDREKRRRIVTDNQKFMTTFNRKTNLLENLETLVPLKMRQNMGWIIANKHFAYDPCCFYIQSMNKFEELGQMMEDLEKVVQLQQPIDPTEIERGMFVAAQVLDERARPYFVRLIIKQYMPQIKMVKGILIDYGVELSSQQESLRTLPSYFAKIPSFCQRAHLDIFHETSLSRKHKQFRQLKPSDMKGWNQETAEQFKDILRGAKNAYNSVYYAWQPSMDENRGLVKLEAFNQSLVYDDEKASWFPKPVKRNPDFSFIDDQKNHPLLRQFFTSIGIDIIIEEVTEEYEKYQFTPLWALLANS